MMLGGGLQQVGGLDKTIHHADQNIRDWLISLITKRASESFKLCKKVVFKVQNTIKGDKLQQLS